jgi:hypothetical protein
MKLILAIAALAVVSPLSTHAAGVGLELRQSNVGQTTKPGSHKHRRPRPKMTKQTRTPIAPGNWAGDGIKLEIGESGSALQFACAQGEITERLMRDPKGDFSAAGTYTRRTPGPQRDGGDAASKATFIGRITGNTMTMKVVLTGPGTTVGEFTLELNRKTKLIRCL